jgi:hypothetical protein
VSLAEQLPELGAPLRLALDLGMDGGGCLHARSNARRSLDLPAVR